jgi:hypothetical protein
MSYAVIRQAILDRSSLTATYDGAIRHFSPHAIGGNDGGESNIMAFQYAGGSSMGLPTGGQWRCFRVNGLYGVRRNEDPWHSGHGHSRPTTYVIQIDVEVRG